MRAKTAAPEQTIKLADTANMLHRLAEAAITQSGEYFCMIDGKRTRVIREVCHVVGCERPATYRATPLAGKSRKPFVTCEDCKPGSKRPVDAPWPMCFTVAPL